MTADWNAGDMNQDLKSTAIPRMSTYRVRFAPTNCAPGPDAAHASALISTTFRPGPRSRSGCWQCRLHKVKCDETFPVCLRCQKRGHVCRSSPRLSRWQIEMQWVSCPLDAIVKRPLLQYWLERASQMLVIDVDNNPYSFPILHHFTKAPSLVHIIQSLSAAHYDYFPGCDSIVSLEERGRTLQLLQGELSNPQKSEASFLTITLLGLAHWANPDPRDFGGQHLFAAQNIINEILSRCFQNLPNGSGNRNLYALCVGSFLYWDMCCAHLVNARQQRRLDAAAMVRAIRALGTKAHPTYGPATELIYLLGEVGRYCREVIQLGYQDAARAASLVEQVRTCQVNQSDQLLSLLYESFQKHALILLHHTRVHPPESREGEVGDGQIRRYAMDIISNLSNIPITSNMLNIQALPLVTAGSELDSCDTELRQAVVLRLKAIYSMNRVHSTLQAVSLLEELWGFRDSGRPIFWMEYMIVIKGWRLLLG